MANLRANNLTGTGGRNAIKGSVYFSGYVEGASSDYLYLQDSDDLDMGTGDFTFECWLNAVSHVGTNSPNFMGIFSSGAFTAGGFLIQVNNTGPLRLVIPLAAGGNFEESAGPSLWGSWNHIAVVKTSNVIKGFVNGVEVISASHSVGIDFAHGGYATVGENCKVTYPGDYPLRGHVSNLRLVKGTALYTSSFTPSTEELTAVDGTVLLCCQDTDDPTQEATGKHEIIGIRKCYEGKRYSNIATNGDLETGDTTGWTNNGCATFEVTTGNSHSGSYSLHCLSDGNGDGVSFSTAVDTNLRYKISAYMKCVGPVGTSAKAKMKVGSAFGDSTNYESQTVGYDSYKTFDEWDYVEWIGFPSASTTYISFVESSANDANEWYVDDLRVEVWFPEETENILANPKFLTGATGWSFSSTPSGEYTISSDKLNLADNSRTGNAYATQQIIRGSTKEGRYRIHINYAVTSGAFDFGVGNSNVWTISGTAGATHELEADGNNANFRIIGNQHCVASWTNVTLYRIAEPKRINELPPVGIDEGVTFEGETKVNTQNYMYFPTGDTSQRSRGRCIISNGSPGSQSLYYLQMQSGGIVQNFGLLANNVQLSRACGSSTRMLVADGYIAPATTNVIEYITIATTGGGTDYGDLTVARRRALGMANTTRGVWVGGTGASPAASYYNEQDYNTIASAGNATDFGDASTLTSTGNGVSSSTRGVYSIAHNGSTSAYNNTLEYITFATTGSRTNFGDLSAAKGYHMCGCSSSDSTRGLFAGGYNPVQDTIDYITMASTGDATDFGNLSVARRSGMATGNSIDAIFVGGYLPGVSNTIDKVTIQTTGDAVDFGDLTVKFHEGAASSDSHGGLS